MTEDTRVCKVCKKRKPIDDFYLATGKHAHWRTCKKCVWLVKRQKQEPTRLAKMKERELEISQLREKVVLLYNRGLGNREIARELKIPHYTIGYWLRKWNLPTNNPRGIPPEPIDETHARCKSCNEVRHVDEFALVRSYEDGRKLSICRQCRRNHRKIQLNDPSVFFAEKQGRLRNNTRGLPFDLPKGYLLRLWTKQNGLCFYTEEPMILNGSGVQPNSLSIDRMDNERGYVVGNVVLCLNKVNSVKRNLTLDELDRWIPLWGTKIRERLKNV